MHSDAALKIQMEIFIWHSFLFNVMHSAESAEVLMLCFYWFYQDHTWFTAQQNWLTAVPVTFCVLLYIFFVSKFILQAFQPCPLFQTNWKSASAMWLCTVPTPAAVPWDPAQSESAAGPVVWDYWMWPLNRVSSADLTVYPSPRSYVPSVAGGKEPPVWLLLSDLWCCALLDPIV